MFDLFDLVLYALGKKGPLSISDLATMLRADKKAVRKVVDRMRARGLAETVGVNDKKLLTYGLTQDGQLLYLELAVAIDGVRERNYVKFRDAYMQYMRDRHKQRRRGSGRGYPKNI